ANCAISMRFSPACSNAAPDHGLKNKRRYPRNQVRQTSERFGLYAATSSSAIDRGKYRVMKIFLPTLSLLLVCVLTGWTFSQTTTPANSQPAQSARPSARSKAGSSTAIKDSAPDYQDEAWRVLSLGLKSPKAAQRTEAVKALSLMSE